MLIPTIRLRERVGRETVRVRAHGITLLRVAPQLRGHSLMTPALALWERVARKGGRASA